MRNNLSRVFDGASWTAPRLNTLMGLERFFCAALELERLPGGYMHIIPMLLFLIRKAFAGGYSK
jgi:hypothetical protein